MTLHPGTILCPTKTDYLIEAYKEHGWLGETVMRTGFTCDLIVKNGSILYLQCDWEGKSLQLENFHPHSSYCGIYHLILLL